MAVAMSRLSSLQVQMANRFLSKGFLSIFTARQFLSTSISHSSKPLPIPIFNAFNTASLIAKTRAAYSTDSLKLSVFSESVSFLHKNVWIKSLFRFIFTAIRDMSIKSIPILIRPLLMFAVIMAFYGCATKQTFTHNLIYRTYEIFSADSRYILYIAKDNSDVYHFALFDTFGTPIVSRIFENGRFGNDKFLLPNSSFDSLFLAILNNPSSNQVKTSHIKAVAIDLSK